MNDLIHFFEYGFNTLNVIEAIESKVLNDMDISIKINLQEYEKVGFKEVFQISTSKIGPMSQMINHLEVTIESNIDLKQKVFNLIYDFSYKHTQRGRNGYKVHYKFNRIGKIID